MKKRILTELGYIRVRCPEHHRADKSGAYEGYVYEHVLVAEKTIGRSLRRSEEVHHLDFNRLNNRPSNLLVLLASQHTKLHHWLRVIGYNPPKISKKAFLSHCARCKVCSFPVKGGHEFCSSNCSSLSHRKTKRPSKEELTKKLKALSWVAIGRQYGVSDNAVRKWAKAYKLLP